MSKLTLANYHNLSMNADTLEEIDYHRGEGDTIKTRPAAYPYTVLSMYYFKDSANDHEEKLRAALTKTYNNRWSWYKPLETEENQ